MPTASSFPQRVKQAVLAAEPEAEVYLFGSRARGDARSNSDWDFLVLLNGSVDWERERALRHHLYEIGWTENEVASFVIRQRGSWYDEEALRTPFQGNVRREGILL